MKNNKTVLEYKELFNLKNVAALTWEHLNLPSPTPIQYDIIECLEGILKPVLGLKNSDKWFDKFSNATIEREGKRVPTNRFILQAARGVGKSVITGSIVPWLLAVNPDLNILVVSASQNKATDFSTFAKRLIVEMPIYQPLIADTQKGQRWSNISFDVRPAGVDQAPSVRSVTIGGTLTGGRADIIICDDGETPNTSDTQTARIKLQERVKEFDAVLKPNGCIIYLGTPQVEDSLYNVLTNRGYKKIIWPGRFPDSKWLDNNGPYLASFIANQIEENPSLQSGGGLDGSLGAPTNPLMFSEEDLQEREASYGRSGFALQYLLDTTLSDQNKFPLKLADFIVMDVDKDLAPERPVWGSDASLALTDVDSVGLKGDRFYRAYRSVGEMLPYKGSVLAIDPAGMGEDELAYAVVKQLNGYLYITACNGLKGGFEEKNLEFLADLAKEHKVTSVIIEKNFGGGMFTSLFTPVLTRKHRCMIEEVTSSKQKELRIIGCLEPLLNQHRLVVDKNVIIQDNKKDWHDKKGHLRKLFYQLTRISKDRGSLVHDDRLDALAMACQYWLDAAKLDANKQINNRQSSIYMKEMKETLKAPIGRKVDRYKRDLQRAKQRGETPSMKGRKPKGNWLK